MKLVKPSDPDARRRQREFLANIKSIREAVVRHRRELGSIINRLAALEEIAASGQNHAAAVYVEYQRAWCKVLVEADYDGNAAADMRVLRKLVTQYGADEVKRRLRLYFESSDRWTKTQRYSLAVFQKQYHQLTGGSSGAQTAVDRMAAKGLYD